MFTEIISLVSYGYYGGEIGNVLAQWEQMGVFTYMLPFLVIFSLVFAILTRLQIFKENRTINGIIALAVGLMALQFDFVPRFFSEVFPRMGVALSIILVFLVLAGMFIDPENKGWMVGLMVIVILVAGIVIFQSFGATGMASYWYILRQNFSTILAWGILIGFILIVIIGSNPLKKQPSVKSILAEALRSKSP